MPEACLPPAVHRIIVMLTILMFVQSLAIRSAPPLEGSPHLFRESTEACGGEIFPASLAMLTAAAESFGLMALETLCAANPPIEVVAFWITVIATLSFIYFCAAADG